MVQRVLKAELDLLENLAPSVPLEKRVNWESQDYRVIQDDKDLRVRAVSPASLEPTARKEPGALQGNLVREVKEVQRVLVEPEEPEVRRENQVLRAQQGTTAPQVHPVREDLKDLRDPWVSPDQRAPLDHLERTDCPDILASVEKRVSKEKLVHLAQEVLSGLRDPLERPVQSVSEVIPDPLDHQESRVFQEQVAKKEQRETLDLLEPPVKTAPLVCEASLESEVYLAPRAQQV